MPRLELAGKLVVVAGASSGLGREIALCLALQEKANVIVAARRRDRLEALKAEIEARAGVCAHVVAVDLAQPEGPEALFREASARGPVAALVNCAGTTYYGRTLDAPLETVRQILSVNQLATMQTTTLFLRSFLERGSGAILTVTSVLGLVPCPYQNLYSATKHAVQSFMEGLSREYRGRGITFCTFAAATMATEMLTAAGLDRRFSTGSPIYLDLVKTARRAVVAFVNGKPFAIPGAMYKIAFFITRLVSRRFLLWAVERIYRPEKTSPEGR